MDQRNRKRERSSLVFPRDDFKRSVESFRSLTHARETVAGALLRNIEAAPVVAQPQNQAVRFGAEFNVGVGASRVPDNVVDGFFEQQEKLAADVCANLNILFGDRRSEA